MRIVFDTNVLISSTLWEDSVSKKLLIELMRLGIKVFESSEILSEYKKVLVKNFGYSENESNYLVGKILSFVDIVEPTEKVIVVEADPTDNKIIECALSSSSEYIASYDKHLLEIKEFKGIKIVKPEELLRIL